MSSQPLKILKDNLLIIKELSIYDNEVNSLINPITIEEHNFTHIKISFREQFNAYSAELGILKDNTFYCIKYFEYCDYVEDDTLDFIELVEL
jgi:hypothetical protein